MTTPVSADILEAFGLTCGELEPLMAGRLRRLAPGEVLEVQSDQPEVADGIKAWVWLAGHALVAVEPGDPPSVRYYVRKKDARA